MTENFRIKDKVKSITYLKKNTHIVLFSNTKQKCAAYKMTTLLSNSGPSSLRNPFTLTKSTWPVGATCKELSLPPPALNSMVCPTTFPTEY